MRISRETLSSSNRLFLLRQFLFPAKCRRPIPVPLVLLCLVAVLLFCLWPIFLPQPVAKFRQQIGTESAPSEASNKYNDNASLSSLNSSSTELALQLAFGHQVWAQLRSLNCARLFAKDVNITRTAKSHRIVQRDPDKLDMECTAVRARWKFVADADSQEEAQFPLAFARTVYRDYLFLEQMFSVEYAPQNAYCFSLDAKADSKFKRRMRSLASCFPNVWVADTEFSISSNGKNVSRSHLACLEVLRREAKWKYVILLQNHDIPLRTNAEFVRILRVFNGTNDMSTRRVVPISVNTSLDWSVRSLGLYRNESQIPRKLLPDYKLQHTKSLNLVALSRAAVEFSLDQLNLVPLIEQLEKSKYGMDEVLFSTLNSNLPDFPGGFTTECLFRQNHIVQSMGRYTLWRNYGTQTGRCMSNHFRHDLCVYGVEDLPHIQTARLHFYLNKMMPSFDFGAIFCWLNALHTRRSQQAMGKEEPDVNERFYQQLEHVRFNHLRIQNQLDRFKC